MIQNLIHMTQGEFILQYWKIYLAIFIIGVLLSLMPKKKSKPFNPFKEG